MPLSNHEGINAMLENEEIHNQLLSKAQRLGIPHSIYKDAYFYNPRTQPIRNFWNNIPLIRE